MLILQTKVTSDVIKYSESVIILALSNCLKISLTVKIININ